MTTAEVAVEPTPERRLRTPLAYYALCLLAGLISLGLQLATGTDPTVALHLAAATTLGLLAVVVTGPLSIPGLLNLILVGKFLLVAVILKSLLFFEPMDVRLAAPLQTSRVMLLGFAGVFVASCLVSLIRTQRSTLPSLDQPEQYFWITFLLIFAGYGSWFLGKEHSLGGGAYSGGFWSLLQSLKIFGPVSVATAMLYVWKSGKKRYLSHPLVVATVIVGTAVGLVTTRKLEIMTPVFVFVVMAAVRYGLRSALAWVFGLLGVLFFVFFVFPFVESMKGSDVRTQSDYVDAVYDSLAVMLLDPTVRTTAMEESGHSKFATRSYLGGGKWTALNRFAMVGEASRLISGTMSRRRPSGWKTIDMGFRASVPRVLMPKKPDRDVGNYLAHVAGDVHQGDSRTTVAYGFMANFYEAFGLRGVLVGTTLLLLALFGWFRLFFGDSRGADIWVVFVVFTMHHSIAEGSVGTLLSAFRLPIFAGMLVIAARIIPRLLQPDRPPPGTAEEEPA